MKTLKREKRCPDCGITKLLLEWGKNAAKPNGLQGCCKDCRNRRTREYRLTESGKESRRRYRRNHKEIIHQHNVKYAKMNSDSWIKWFKKRYGNPPHDEITGEELSWDIGSINKVHFDHRNGNGIIIKKSPSSYCLKHPCNNKYKEIWENENFGILSRRTNLEIPTINRKKWASKFILDLIRYVYGLDYEYRLIKKDKPTL